MTRDDDRTKMIRLALLFAAITLAGADPLHYTYWVQPCTDPPSMCQPDDPKLAQWAFEAWEKASDGELEFTRVNDREHARIRLNWASAEQGMYGETTPIFFEGHIGRGGLCAAIPIARERRPVAA